MNKRQKKRNIPLSSVKVVDLGRVGAGPICTMILADMGAQVIKIEEPGTGDSTRWSFPQKDDIGGLFPYWNRNKKSITLNLNTEKGKKILLSLVRWGDVLVENFRPGFMKRIGFDYPSVHKVNPRMVMVSISGFGQTGPYKHKAGLDTV